jgi:hypothetical protein
MEASRSALAAQGMGNCMALVYGHHDEDCIGRCSKARFQPRYARRRLFTPEPR